MQWWVGVLLSALLAIGCAPSAGTSGPADSPPPAPRSSEATGRPRIGFAGDSMMAGLTPALRAAFGPAGAGGRFTLYAELPRRADAIGPRARALAELGEVVVLMIGVWEASVLAGGQNELVDPSAPDWATTYRNRVVQPFLDAVRSEGSKVIWVGMTPVEDPLEALGFGELNEVYRQAVAEVPGMTYVDAWGLFDARSDEVGRDPEDPLTAVDRLHLCPAGAALIADAVVASAGGGLRDQAPADWQSTDWTQRDWVLDRRWYDSTRC